MNTKKSARTKKISATLVAFFCSFRFKVFKNNSYESKKTFFTFFFMKEKPFFCLQFLRELSIYNMTLKC